MKVIFSLSFFLASFFTRSQNNIVLFDSVNNIPIAYARIAYLGLGTSSYTNLDGTFLSLPNSKKVTVSHPQYIESVFSIENTDSLYLELNRISLNEVILSQGQKIESKIKRGYSKDRLIGGQGQEYVSRIELNQCDNVNESAYLAAVSIPKSFFHNDAAVVFRINIYENENQYPGPILGSKIFRKNRNTKDVTIRFTESFIEIPTEGIFVGIEPISIKFLHPKKGNSNFGIIKIPLKRFNDPIYSFVRNIVHKNWISIDEYLPLFPKKQKDKKTKGYLGFTVKLLAECK